MSIDTLAIRPGDRDYETARLTRAGAGSPRVVLRPRTTAEVVEAVRHATGQRLPLAVRGGGHSALGFGNVDDGAVVDLSRLHDVEVLDGTRVRVGAGATWGQAAGALAARGLAVSSGDTASVGVGGLTQVGGIGWMVRRHGLALDSLLAAEVVTASGDVVRASEDEHADLFWGLRGGAGNFGVVTAFEFRAQPVTALRFGTITFALDDVAGLVARWAEVMRSAPEELTTTLALMPALGPFPASATLWVSSCADDPAIVEPLLGLGAVSSWDIEPRPYPATLGEAPPAAPGVMTQVDNVLVDRVDGALAGAVADAYACGGRLLSLRSLGGAFGRVPVDATAFAHRRAEALVVSVAMLPSGAGTAQVARAREIWQGVGCHGDGTYAGFLASDGEADVARVWPEPTRRRLVEVKRAWDPHNVFRRTFNVSP